MDYMQHNKEEEMRLKRKDDEETPFTIHTFIHWWLVPGMVGVIGTIILAKIITGLFMDLSNGTNLGKSADKVLDKLNVDFNYLLQFEWSKTDIWAYMIFGFLVGVLIKYAYSDEKIR
ncbi:MAG: hypothetical protein MK052_01740 [Alphaproteobacteria bacterium]|nr:hypothetical protein [Alphaproteobacteria bacterium]